MKQPNSDAVPTSHRANARSSASCAKSEANRKNALKSTGPKTQRGKRYSRSNALKHGLYSKELLISEADKAEFQELRVGLNEQLKPGTMLQGIAVDSFVACIWRCKLAMRLEHRQFDRQFNGEQRDEARGAPPQIDVVIEGWYGQGRAHILKGIRALESAREEFEDLGYFPEETKAFLKRGFGEGFLRLLEEWPTMSWDAVLLANHLAAHTEKFGKTPNAQGETSNTLGEKVRVVKDPMQLRQMVGKLLEERRNYLMELSAIMRRNMLDGTRDSGPSADVNTRLLADANRDLRGALGWYLFLKDKGL